jgi:chaperonin cofactor prefoldin
LGKVDISANERIRDMSTEMKTVKQTIEELQQYPEDAFVYAYEGAIIIVTSQDILLEKTLGMIDLPE